MGKIFYGATDTPIELDDRVLAHLAAIVATKLRRNESFTLTYNHGDDPDEGRSMLWLQPSIPLRFVFDSAESERLDQKVLQDMATDAASSRGLYLRADLFDERPAIAAVTRAA